MKGDKISDETARLFEESVKRGPVVNKDSGGGYGKKQPARPAKHDDPHVLTVDLHGCSLDDALSKTSTAITRGRQGGYTDVRIITGTGKHSPGLFSPLNTGIEDYLAERKIEYKKSDGAFTVCLK